MPPDDKLIIETPEQTVLEFPLAGIGSRALALVIDTALQIGVALALLMIAALVAYAAVLPAFGRQWAYAVLILLGFLLEFGYFAFFEAVWNGQTPGKRWTHLRVMEDSGRPIGTQGAILRNLLRIVDSFPGLYAVGIITSLFSSQNKRLGDYLAGTVVVREKNLEGKGVWDISAPAPSNAAQTLVLSSAELQLVETFLERRANLEPDVRFSMARRIAERLGKRGSVPPEARPDAEKFLENLAERSRGARR